MLKQRLINLKYLFLIVFIIFSFKFSLNAKVISRDTAIIVANKFFEKIKTKSSSLNFVFTWDSNSLFPKTRSNSDSPTFYVFSNSEGPGFVIISADDDVFPILGYSLDSKLCDINNLPDNFKGWMSLINDQIKFLRTQSLDSYNISNSWADLNFGNDIIRYQTASWGQRVPENTQCPYDGSKQSVAGCVPIALAIKMHYHKWPVKGNGMSEAYYTKEKGIYVPQRNLDSFYDWENMLMEYFTHSYTNVQADAVSRLVADIGAVAKADYTNSTTGVYDNVIYDVVVNKFNYSSNLQYIYRAGFSDQEWNRMIKEELINNGPVYYTGGNFISGHAFILDGVTDNDYFHVNWGWSSYCNGYFSLNSLIADGSRLNDYSEKQSACFNFKPANPDSEEIYDDSDLKFYELGGLYSNIDEYYPYVSFKVNAEDVLNCSLTTFNGHLKLALVDRDNNIIEWISDEVEFYNLAPNSYRYNVDFNCLITNNIAFGFRIRCFYKSDNGVEWKLIRPRDASIMSATSEWEILLSDEFSIEESTSITYKEDRSILINVKEGVIVSLLYNGDDITDKLVFDNLDITIPKDILKKGNYLLSLKKGIENKELSFIIK